MISITISFFGYLAVLVLIGGLTYRLTKTLGDFILAGRKLGIWVTAISAKASDMSGWLILGVPGVGYDLITATSPNPDQIIQLFIDRMDMDGRQQRPATILSTLEPTNMPVLQIGDTLQFRTGTIYDHNQYAVPDGTVVRFIITSGGEIGTSQQIETTTRDGIAQATYLVQDSGIYDVRVSSDPASNSEVIQINIDTTEELNGNDVQEIVITQTVEPTQTLINEPDLDEERVETAVKRKPNSVEWLLSMLIVWGVGFLIYRLGKKKVSNRWAIRWSLMAIIGGTAAYLYLAIGLPGSAHLIESIRFGGILAAVLSGLFIGWVSGYIWRRRSE